MGFATVPQEVHGKLSWEELTDHMKSNESVAVSTITSATSISSSLSSDFDEFPTTNSNMTWKGPLLRLTYCFFSNPSNTACADCRKKLFMDGQCDIFISYHNNDEKTNDMHNKESLKPQSTKGKEKRAVSYAVFICVDCARAHRTLSSEVTKLKALTNPNEVWTKEEMCWIERHSGNDKMNFILERYKPKNYTLDLNSGSLTLQNREVYVRAKYQALAFLFPKILKGSEMIHTQNESNNTKSMRKPSRLIDFFCVIGSNGYLEKQVENRRDGPVKFQTEILDCYPEQSFHSDMTFPQHVSKFVFPEGCIPYLSEAKPGFFAFVLTLENGDRLYGAALHIYEENSKTEFIHSFQHLQMVNFFLPKCLTILSHYPLFDTFHSILLQLYHISHSPSNPLPLERYVAHFTREIPLPPQGKVEVFAKLLPQLPQIKISRPSQNELPLIGFSLQPLFSCLSAGNVMLVFSCLLSETRVVICSKYYSLLTPICEALLGLLFPLVWQGCYIPILPYHMLDVLDAPFPYLIGVHSRYLREYPSKPQGPVYVDLDDDIVHLGFDEEVIDGVKQICGRRTPSLPEKEAEKLKRVLDENADSIYIPPVCQQKGRITYGNFEHMNNGDRELYAVQVNLDHNDENDHRDYVLTKMQLAYNQQVVSMHNFGMKNDHSVVRKGHLLRFKSLENDTNLKKLKPIEGFNLYDRSGDETGIFSGKQIRLGFLRFFVSLLLNYEKYIDKETGSLTKMEFLKALHLSDSNQRDFVSSMISTQMFEKFIEESTSNEKKTEIKFFDESIIAKKNRSRARAALNGKKETPFLSDESGVINKTYHTQQPSTVGLPIKSKSYFYVKFPRLNSKLFGKISEPKEWAETDQDSLSIMPLAKQSMASALWSTESLSSNICSKEYVLTGVRDVEWALQALAYRYFDQDKESFFSDVLSKAQELVLSSRDKQLSNLKSFVTIQSLMRMRGVRRRFVRLRAAVVRIQRRHKAIRVGSSYTLVFSSRAPLYNKDQSGPVNPENVEVILCD